ncbi:hypothetical protein WG936_03295 [Corynebacterium sp. H127]|uniref:hypothetical protein n=1 Tax=Corynebacterium sp. H127 TaxID=3133418 RepID=UPI0030ABB688
MQLTSGTPDSAWLESITLFQQIRYGDQVGAFRLLTSTPDPAATLRCFLRMLHVFLSAEEEEKLDHFINVAFNVGPPPMDSPAR